MPNSTVNGSRVLVLDDDELIGKLLGKSLSRRGYVVSAETCPQRALSQIATDSIDLVVSDLNMEGLDGLAFTQRVVALALDIPVILITGSSAMETAVKAVLAGAWDFLSKPIDQAQLFVSMERACQHRALRKELRSLRAQVDRSA